MNRPLVMREETKKPPGSNPAAGRTDLRSVQLLIE